MATAATDIGMMRQLAVKSPRSPDASCSRRARASRTLLSSSCERFPSVLAMLVTPAPRVFQSPSSPPSNPSRVSFGRPQRVERPREGRCNRAELGAMKEREERQEVLPPRRELHQHEPAAVLGSNPPDEAAGLDTIHELHGAVV